jgi:hypothetical protein
MCGDGVFAVGAFLKREKRPYCRSQISNLAVFKLQTDGGSFFFWNFLAITLSTMTG